jgi:hypothetical protein
VTRFAPSISHAKPCSTFGNPRLIRWATIWKPRSCSIAMQDRLRQLGWHEMEVIDEGLGRSAAGTQTRTGFERMVAEVCLGRVGVVAAREVSRFARNSREWAWAWKPGVLMEWLWGKARAVLGRNWGGLGALWLLDNVYQVTERPLPAAGCKIAAGRD